ncbi:Tetracycline resistance protein, class C [Roseovarius albus]|uniref:Tetracycline resistance protein, class C n=1 Tax=Roseovarius albus TaxID=1247867 RepID=A0A1X6Z4X6_9RHOB|nr:MFS transporter [Roseovarius albus]SLN40482.1 Tetracycline resistance protein, class C [Roseovarius albus]
MTNITKITLLFVVFVDLLGQGLVFPIINTLIMSSDSSLLSKSTPTGMRHFYYGLVIGSFFLSWFLGVVYVSKVSDSIGRKNALLVCLTGALIGYAITILSLYLESLALLILGRCITGFTAGNQPIAQAAMIDGSSDDADRDRNMGYIITGVSFGLVGGPIIGAILSDKALLGGAATLKTPFFGAFVLVSIAIFLVMVYYKDSRTEREPFVFRLRDITDSLFAVKNHPLVLKLLPVYSLFMIANVTFYVFVDNYLTSAFGYGVVGGSMAMVTIGFALAFSSTVLVKPAQERFTKFQILCASMVTMIICALFFVFSPFGVLSYVPVFFFYFFFGVAYPTILGIFSSSVSESDQGWVMGVTTAVFCLAGGVMSLIGGGLMSIDIRLPYYIVFVVATLALTGLFMRWRSGDIKKLIS